MMLIPKWVRRAGVACGIIVALGCGEKDGTKDGESGGAPAAPKVDTVESIAGDLQERMLAFAKAARSPKDVASAKEAADTLRGLGGEMKEIAERLVKLEIPPEEVRRKLGKALKASEAKIEEQMGDPEDTWDKLDPASSRIFEEGIGAFGEKMQEAMVVFKEYFETENLEE
ncbi:MAG: hypothetical protein VCA35_15555 [Roseibacillus sp.]